MKSYPFDLADWRSDKSIDGVFAKSARNPDLEIEYLGGAEQVRFAVECKWRRRLFDASFRWGDRRHIERYSRFQREKRIPVYLLLGVGGTGANPERVFLVPLKDAHYTSLFLTRLEKHDHVRGNGVFAFDRAAGRLRLRQV